MANNLSPSQIFPHSTALLCGRHGRILRFAWLACWIERSTLTYSSAIFGNPTISLKISWICPFVNWIRRLLQRDSRTYCVQSLSSRGPIVCLACFDVGDTGDRQTAWDGRNLEPFQKRRCFEFAIPTLNVGTVGCKREEPWIIYLMLMGLACSLAGWLGSKTLSALRNVLPGHKSSPWEAFWR